MILRQLCDWATNKSRFSTLQAYYEFADAFLNFLPNNYQARIVSRNENHYCFYQYTEEAQYQITRPVNCQLMMNEKELRTFFPVFRQLLHDISRMRSLSQDERKNINRLIYTLQQSIGAVLDALPTGKSNTARKINGDLFERLILYVFQELRRNELQLDVGPKVIQVPVCEEQKVLFTMSYQHDLVFEQDGEVRLIGSVKTSSKDRLDKIFVDKFLYNRLTDTQIPHIAVFLNDVQRKKTRNENEFGVNSTFLPGHFKGYTIKLNPLDGVYYCDIRPDMQTDSLLNKHIQTFDCLICEDLWEFLST
ncbi:MAG: hypothetical protein ACRC10_06450 [Thermoguttaceae bacterium]